MTYGTLKSDIASFVQRDDLTAVIPTWVRFATAALNRELRTPEMESRDTQTLTTEFTGLPSDFLEMRSVTTGAGEPMRYLGNQQFVDVVAQGDNLSPPVYTIDDYQLRIYPAPTVAEPLAVVINYYEEVAALVADPDTNWVLEKYPDVYLYGALVHARAWLHDDQRLLTVKALYDQGLAALKRRKPHATGIVSAVGTGVPIMASAWNMARG